MPGERGGGRGNQCHLPGGGEPTPVAPPLGGQIKQIPSTIANDPKRNEMALGGEGVGVGVGVGQWRLIRVGLCNHFPVAGAGELGCRPGVGGCGRVWEGWGRVRVVNRAQGVAQRVPSAQLVRLIRLDGAGAPPKAHLHSQLICICQFITIFFFRLLLLLSLPPSFMSGWVGGAPSLSIGG